MEQLLLHLTGDYLLQSEHMGTKKRFSTFWAALHALVYSLPFLLLLKPSWTAWGVIFGTHLLIDRFGLARQVVWTKNILLGFWPERVFCALSGSTARLEEWKRDGRKLSWANCRATGYPAETPAWLAGMLLIVADNTLHLVINWASLRWL